MSVKFNLDAPCDRFFTYRNLIECGNTWNDQAGGDSPIDNMPRADETWTALESLCLEVLDPIARTFGRPTLTYAFASPALSAQIRSRIAPHLDQHAAHECGKSGRLLCPRLGAAADLLVPGRRSSQVARWVFQNTRFDRMYLYGDDRPLHVSYGPDYSRSVVELVEGATGHRTPKIVRWASK